MQQNARPHIPETGKMEKLDTLFAELADAWQRQTRFHSNPAIIERHPAFQQILGMGESAVPLIFRRMENQGGHWFHALNLVTGAQPIPVEHSGDVEKMTAAWLRWGREQGYSW